jgi:multidrug efflux pump subunit AcrA (membrane-fusion protein)
MKKIVSFCILLSTFAFATEYYAKVEPVNTYKVKSSVSGKVVKVYKEFESKFVKDELIVKIDDSVNKIDLKQSQIKLDNLKQIQQFENETLKRFNKVSSKSKYDKDNQKIKILNVISNISDLETKIATLKDTIKNKNLYEKNRYIYTIAVEEGDYVNPGTHLYTAMDLSFGKLEVFLPIDTAASIQDKLIYIDGKQTDLKIAKLYSVADTQHISSYKCEIIIPKPEQFSVLVKVEFK